MLSKDCNPHPTLIAITGGIGSGKSVVARVLLTLGYKVYDCDSRAKRLMDTSEAIVSAIATKISRKAISPDGRILRSVLSEIVFSNPDKLQRLNAIVHSAVREDIAQWVNHNSSEPLLWIETAILYQSGLDAMVDQVWEVTAPQEVRVNRVIDRNGLTADQVISRINSQRHIPNRPHPSVRQIVNDGIEPILPQITDLLK